MTPTPASEMPDEEHLERCHQAYLSWKKSARERYPDPNYVALEQKYQALDATYKILERHALADRNELIDLKERNKSADKHTALERVAKEMAEALRSAVIAMQECELGEFGLGEEALAAYEKLKLSAPAELEGK